VAFFLCVKAISFFILLSCLVCMQPVMEKLNLKCVCRCDWCHERITVGPYGNI
jgi:hypothetical protein